MHGQGMGMCRCGHHIVAKILGILGFIGAVLFFYTAIANAPVWGFGPNFYFEAVVIFGFMVWGMKMCGCCQKMCMQGKCGSCGQMGCGGACKSEGATKTCDHKNCTCGHDDCKNCKA